ncbi:guanylyl cyclase-activating protein 2-like [Engraulis encrasicolus]|uniref:guanylyl cyclase-activating protein 2-like n=1 Tax=Engraulis encrasicolus TaxID=184585 RepID=UPI002FD5E24A
MGHGASSAHEVSDEVALTHIQELYKRFASECPSGNLYLHEFKKIFGIGSNCSAEESAYVENIFRSFDTNNDNTIDFMEYVAAVHLILRGKLEDKLKWSFKVYDRDGNGRLDKREVRHIIKIISKIRGHENPSAVGMSPDEVSDRVFQLVDINNDGQISLEEFLEGAQRDEWVMEQLKIDLRPTGWFFERSANAAKSDVFKLTGELLGIKAGHPQPWLLKWGQRVGNLWGFRAPQPWFGSIRRDAFVYFDPKVYISSL